MTPTPWSGGLTRAMMVGRHSRTLAQATAVTLKPYHPRLKRLQPSERASYQREVAAVCEREICYLGYVEPPEVVVLCRRSINGISAHPLLDEPDPQDESGLNDSDKFGPRLSDQYSQLLFQLTSQRLDGRFPVLHMPTGKVPYIWVPSPTSGAVAQQHSAVAHQQRGHDFMGFPCGHVCWND
jgi:hypothetical protein